MSTVSMWIAGICVGFVAVALLLVGWSDHE